MRRLGHLGTNVLLAAGVLIGLALVVPSLLGYERYVIVSGSMTGTYDRGSVVVDEVVPVSDLRVGDVITYRPPAGAGPSGWSRTGSQAIGRDPQGRRLFRTRGDANPSADPWTFTLGKPTQARVVAGVPWIGFGLAALSDRRVRLLVVGLPALIIACSVLGGLWREAGAHVEGEPA